jgi:hypothetical protein
MENYFSKVKFAIETSGEIQQLVTRIDEPGIKLDLIADYTNLKFYYNSIIDFFNEYYNIELNGHPVINDEIKANIIDNSVKILTELKKQHQVLPKDL